MIKLLKENPQTFLKVYLFVLISNDYSVINNSLLYSPIENNFRNLKSNHEKL